MNGVADATVREIVRADAPVDAAARTRGRLDHGGGDAASRGIVRGRGRDRIIARRQQRQHFEVGMERQFAGRKFLQQVEHRFASGQDLGAVKRGRGAIVADIGKQFRLGHRTACMLRHDLDLLAGRDLLQFDELGQEAADRDDITDRQLRAAAFGDLQSDLVGGEETETAGDQIYQRRIVARDHAEMVADAIRQIRRQLHFDMPGRTFRSVCAALVLQLGVDEHLHRRNTAERHDRIDGGRRHRLDRVKRRIVGAAAEAWNRHQVPSSPPAPRPRTISRTARRDRCAHRPRHALRGCDRHDAANCSSIIRGTDW